MISLPTVSSKRECGECKECCIKFPLPAEPGWWEEDKPAYTPCKFLGCQGCTIHDQPRPFVCTDFRCYYIDGWLPWRPDQCGFMGFGGNSELYKAILEKMGQSMKVANLGECRPRAMVDTPASKIRYWLHKSRRNFTHVLICPYDIDSHDGDLAIRAKKGSNLLVGWRTEEQAKYADELFEWWKA